MPPWLAPLAIGLTAIAARWVRGLNLAAAARLLESRVAPVVFGALTALVVWWAWGSLRALPWVHDEKAFLLQADLFARGRWSGPSPPIPEFFEQFGVLVTPALASKMFPGQSLAMVPGVWLGLPGLIPVVLSGVAGGFVFALARRITNPWVALLTWLLWLTAPWNLRWRASYMSETTTSAACLAAWWATLRWRERPHPAWLAAIAALLAFGAITRPLTMLAFGVPLGIVILAGIATRRSWRALPLAISVGAAILAVIPLWSLEVTGDWRTTPLALYTRQYVPFDTLGLGYDATPPLRALPADLQAAVDASKPAHREHTLGALPRVFAARVSTVIAAVFDSWRGWLPPFLVIGALALRGAGLFALGSAVALVLAYLAYAHDASWIVYYVEAFPVLAFVAALGIWRSLVVLAGDGGRAALAALVLAALAVPACVRDAEDVRAGVAENLEVNTALQTLFERVPGLAIVFVRYAPDHPPHSSIVVNQPEPSEARLWIAYDRGPDNVRLLQLAPERRPYLLDEARLRLSPLPLPPP